jgi:hypothetical protein
MRRPALVADGGAPRQFRQIQSAIEGTPLLLSANIM